MKITILGFFGGYPFNNQATSGYLIQTGDYNLLLDCGSGVLLKLEQVLNPLQLDAVILSHYHADHVADIGVLQHYWQLAPGSKKLEVLPIYGHTADKNSFNRLNWPGATVGEAYEPQHTLKLGPFDVEFMLTKHPVPAYAMRFTERATLANFVFTSDTDYIAALVPFANKTDLLITDTNFLVAPKGPKWHMTAYESGKLAKTASVQQLVLSHLPQYVQPNELKQAAQEEAGDDIVVKCATSNMVITL
ncbi:MBL fold metallo-hydrolase [Paucilactobacillus wasatchensis]|uniref:Metal-dependent hydrolase of the beta-lactamase superfamily III n=1 Tax=Paucilactobacillus wasatchensis TaxID=1335616 RepID=A0A0D0YU43_9LACO|nr:MBL fold metallo-hydrolase [Paucilactobacillus wasatchensis]KIS02789.1 metal-dependent hydrolase of the beta-lactamase superfamily III [Paucilactobacillus wasatchensis]